MGEIDVALRGLVKKFGERCVVDQVTLDVLRGEFLSLLGPSGCGKTTLLRIVAGFEQPDSGTIRLGADDVTRVPAHRRDVNMVFQNYALFPHLDVAGNVAFGLKMMRVNPREIPERVARALALVRLTGYSRRMPTTLSGGEQQRVALARAIVTNPRVLLLDEPMAALDLKLRKGLQEELRRLQRELRMTFIYVTHDQEEALAMSDRVAVMNRGAIEQLGTPKQIYERPATRFAAEFVGTANFFEATGDGSCVQLGGDFKLPLNIQGGVTLLVRPERLRLVESGGLTGRVDEILFQGASTRVLFRVRERIHVLEGSGPDVARLRVGDTVCVAFGTEDIVVLPE